MTYAQKASNEDPIKTQLSIFYLHYTFRHLAAAFQFGLFPC
jgi:hypothetical protein